MPFYRKKGLQEMHPWTPGLSVEGISISEADKANGSPKEGDMIAVNPDNTKDNWLVAAEFFDKNYELVENPFQPLD